MTFRDKILPYVPYCVLVIGVVIFGLQYWIRQPGCFSKHGIPDLMTKAEKEHWLDVYDLADATCWVMAYIAFYLGTFYINGKMAKFMRLVFSVIYWTALMNLLDEKFWDNTKEHKDEYIFFIIIVAHAIVYWIYGNVKGKGIGTNGVGQR